VLIATPDAEHAADLRDVLARKPKGIVVEKPVATEPAEGLRLLEEAERLGIPVLVDFSRRWHSGVTVAARHLAAGRLGKPVAAVFTYSGDSAHSAVHMLDLFHTWWARAGSRRSPAAGRRRVRDPPARSRRRDDLVRQRRRRPILRLGDARVVRAWEGGALPQPRGHGAERARSSSPLLHVPVLTPLERYPMEDEPVLSRLMETLADAIADPDAARALLRREIESQAFSAEVLRCLETSETVPDRARRRAR